MWNKLRLDLLDLSLHSVSPSVHVLRSHTTYVVDSEKSPLTLMLYSADEGRALLSSCPRPFQLLCVCVCERSFSLRMSVIFFFFRLGRSVLSQCPFPPNEAQSKVSKSLVWSLNFTQYDLTTLMTGHLFSEKKQVQHLLCCPLKYEDS